MCDRGVEVDHSTISCWVQKYGPELDQQCHPHFKSTNDSWRVDETYIKVKGEDRYLYRAVDSEGNTLGFLLTAKRNALFCEAPGCLTQKQRGRKRKYIPRCANRSKKTSVDTIADHRLRLR